MERKLVCNNSTCRQELSGRAVVTTCSHIFCLECAVRLKMVDKDENAPGHSQLCPACKGTLPDLDDIAITTLNPTEEYKTSVLSGLSPNIIMECAGRALSFWAYQTSHDIVYQQHLSKTLTEKYSVLKAQLDQTVSEANAQTESLHSKLSSMASEHENMRRKNDELAEKLQEKNRAFLRLQEAHDKARSRAEVSQIQRAASDAVDSTLHQVSQQGVGYGSNGRETLEERLQPPYTFHQGNRFDPASHINSGTARSQVPQARGDNRWEPDGHSFGTSMAATRHSMRQRLLPPQFPGPSVDPEFRTPSSRNDFSRREMEGIVPSFVNNRPGLAGVGLTSGLKVSQAPSSKGLGTSSVYR